MLASILNSLAPSTDAQAIEPQITVPTASSPSLAETVSAEKGTDLVYLSRLSQQVPIKNLNDLELIHPVRISKRLMTDLVDGLVNQLLEIVSALVDTSHERAKQDDPSTIANEIGDKMIRTWFRGLVLATNRPDELSLTSRNTTIVGFLRSGVEVECEVPRGH